MDLALITYNSRYAIKPNHYHYIMEGSHLLSPIKSACGSSGQLPTIYGKSKRPVFSIDINLVQSKLASQTCCRIVTELTWITCGLLRKNLCTISMWLLTVKRTGFEQTDPTADVTNIWLHSNKTCWVTQKILSTFSLFPTYNFKYQQNCSINPKKATVLALFF